MAVYTIDIPVESTIEDRIKNEISKGTRSDTEKTILEFCLWMLRNENKSFFIQKKEYERDNNHKLIGVFSDACDNMIKDTEVQICLSTLIDSIYYVLRHAPYVATRFKIDNIRRDYVDKFIIYTCITINTPMFTNIEIYTTTSCSKNGTYNLDLMNYLLDRISKTNVLDLLMPCKDVNNAYTFLKDLGFDVYLSTGDMKELIWRTYRYDFGNCIIEFAFKLTQLNIQSLGAGKANNDMQQKISVGYTASLYTVKGEDKDKTIDKVLYRRNLTVKEDFIRDYNIILTTMCAIIADNISNKKYDIGLDVDPDGKIKLS